jgi:hypothetical protein
MNACPATLALLCLAPVAAQAMDLYHYDLDSLNYMSTDVVIGTVTARPEHKFTVTVDGIVYGALAAGEKLETLSDFLGFFQPMEDGQQVILFLDRRPHPVTYSVSRCRQVASRCGAFGSVPDRYLPTHS